MRKARLGETIGVRGGVGGARGTTRTARVRVTMWVGGGWGRTPQHDARGTRGQGAAGEGGGRANGACGGQAHQNARAGKRAKGYCREGRSRGAGRRCARAVRLHGDAQGRRRRVVCRLQRLTAVVAAERLCGAQRRATRAVRRLEARWTCDAVPSKNAPVHLQVAHRTKENVLGRNTGVLRAWLARRRRCTGARTRTYCASPKR